MGYKIESNKGTKQTELIDTDNNMVASDLYGFVGGGGLHFL